MAHVEAVAWDGLLPAREEWGGARIRTIGDDQFRKALSRVRLDMVANLDWFSIPCGQWRFVPDRLVGEWARRHDVLAGSFEDMVSSVVSARDDLVALARTTATVLCRESWIVARGESPPPAIIQHAANLVDSLFPSAEDMRESFGVSRSVWQHPYVFALSDKRCSFVGDGERRTMAWGVVDSLLAGNARRLAGMLEYPRGSSNYWTARRLRRTIDALAVFSRTDMEPSVGLSVLADGARAMLEGFDVESLDVRGVGEALDGVSSLAARLSSVSGFLGEMG